MERKIVIKCLCELNVYIDVSVRLSLCNIEPLCNIELLIYFPPHTHT